MPAPPYDPTLKTLVETEPESWPTLFGRPQAPTTVIDADIATVSGAADKVLLVSAAVPYLLHLEFVVGHDVATLPQTLHVRNALLEARRNLPVLSGVVLLRPEADSPQLTGMYQRSLPGEAAYLTFRYQVTRVWQLAPEPLLSGGVSLLALAPISDVTEADLPAIIQRMQQRLSDRRVRRQAAVVWAAAYILLGLRHSPALAAQLFRGVLSMKESSTYQAILEEGHAKGLEKGLEKGLARGLVEGRAEGAVAEAKKVLRLQGDDVFGLPDAATAALIEQIEDVTQLEALLKRLRSTGSWQELLGQPVPRRRSRRRPSP